MGSKKGANKENVTPVTLPRRNGTFSEAPFIKESKNQSRKPLKERNAPFVFTSSSSEKNVSNGHKVSKQENTVSKEKNSKVSSVQTMMKGTSKMGGKNDKGPEETVIAGNSTSSKSTEVLTKLWNKATRQIPVTLSSHVSSLAKVPPSHYEDLPPLVANFPDQVLSNGFSNLSLDPMLSFHNVSLDPMIYLPPFQPPPSPWTLQHPQETFTATVEEPGYTSFSLRCGVVVDVSANMAVRVINTNMNSMVSLSECASQIAVVHPKGRMLQYGVRVEIQIEDNISVKNAKIYPRGISFTANNMALVYLLDEAGARSTSDMFHDLYATQISDMLFMESYQKKGCTATNSIQQLDNTRYWKTEDGVHCWYIGQVFIQQTYDGFVTVEREVLGGKVVITASPSNGKVRVEAKFVQMTASLGAESHMFVRSRDRRFHYNGQSKVFTVRNAGHSAGFDSEGRLRIF